MQHQLSRRSALGLALAGALAATASFATPAAAEINGLEILAASNPGSGFDQVARLVQSTLEKEGLASGIEIANVPGGGGTIGLAQFVGDNRPGARAMITGFAAVGGILTVGSPVTLKETRPLARLVGEQDIIVVPASSDIETLDQLIARLKADPGSVSWGGGSFGGFDHVVVGEIARTGGIDPAKLNYVVHAGGGEAMTSIMGGHVTAGISGYNELAAQVRAGTLRGLAVSGPERIPGLDVPTLTEKGIDVAMVNWRGILAPKNASAAEMEELSTAIDAMVKSATWQEALAARGWEDLYQPSAEFAVFLDSQMEDIKAALKAVGLGG